MLVGDWPAVARIYAEGIATGCATFETEVPSWSAWDAGHFALPRLLMTQAEEVQGWGALSPVSTRACYRGVAEVSIYLAAAARRKGMGGRLLQALVDSAEHNDIWTLQASIFSENSASLRLHARCGFRIVGRREKIARLAGRWRHTLLLERRSPLEHFDEQDGD